MKNLPTKAPFLPLYLVAILQGMSFSTVPAASNFITSQEGLDLSSSLYGSLFLPMVSGSIAASLLAGVFGKKSGLKVLFLLFASFNFLAMLLFSSIAFFSLNTYLLLLVMMMCLGLGFGGMISTLNPFVLFYFPNKASSAITALHACLGIGTALGPILFSMSLQLGFWAFSPLFLTVFFFIVALFGLYSLSNPSNLEKNTCHSKPASKYYLIGFSAIAFIYGILETSFGNWGSAYLFQEKNFTNVAASFALSTFWLFVTIGRVITASITAKLSPTVIYKSLPLLLIIGLACMSSIQNPATAYVIFALAGLGCSSFLPLTITFGCLKYLNQASFVSGLLIAIYMLGYACASEGFALLKTMLDTSFANLYTFELLPAAAMLVCCFVLVKKSKT
jgi:fucose permease